MEKIAATTIQDHAKAHVESIRQLYLDKPKFILEHYETERSNVESYNGRQFLEMIQNADDAAEGAREPKALIHLLGETLTIANTGQPFTEEGLDSLLYSSLSSKYNQKKQIGNKGLGFRSILSWANKVSIKSGALQISFSKHDSDQFLAGLIEDNPEIEKVILRRYKKFHPAIAILRCPKLIESMELSHRLLEYDTIIRLDLKKEVVQNVKDQLAESVDAEMMLFLNHLKEIQVDTPEIKQTIYKVPLSREKIKVFVEEADGTQSVSIWNIHSHSGTRPADEETGREEKNYELSVAWQDDLQGGKGRLHSFFKTNVPFKFPGILHGTFELSPNRKELNDDTHGHNRFLFGLVPRLIAEAAELIAEGGQEHKSYKALTFARVDVDSLVDVIKQAGFEVQLKEEIKKRNIFPTIGDDYINWESEPAYYKEAEFAELLPPADFPDLLLYCEDPKTEAFLSGLKPFTYTVDAIIQTIAANRRTYSHLDYARLIKVLQDRYDEVQDATALPGLFYESSFKLLPLGSAIFLPSEGVSFNIPPEIGINIIHKKLAEALKQVYEVDTFSFLASKLHAYGVKVFNFEEVVELLLAHFPGGGASNSDNIELHKYLFALYRHENNTSSKWSGSEISFISKKSKLSAAGQLYLGREYGNLLNESLYQYDKAKLVAGPEKYGVAEDERELWQSYLIWSGIVSLPRKVQIETSHNYADYCMRHYDFKNGIDKYHFKNYSEFRKSCNEYRKGNVLTVVGLEELLLNNKTETILAWLSVDEEVRKNIENDTEPSSSYLSPRFGQDWYGKTVPGKRMKSYLKWKIASTPWLDTESGAKQAPNLCTTAATITIDFSPLIEKPKVNLQAAIFNSIPLKPDKLDFLLSIVGVHKTVATISTNALFSILLKLPEIDPEGFKVKAIYRELASNYDESFIDEADTMYLKFRKEGLVFCKRQKQSEYISYKQAYYVNDKRYGESIINQFHTIEVERRKNKGRVEKIFGVKPLENLKLSLHDAPQSHPLSAKFEQELEMFKPYVYVLRQEQDTTHRERNRIKEVRFKLVQSLSVGLTETETYVHFDLKPYEYLYLADKQTIYIYTPVDLMEEAMLKGDVNFCSTVAEAFSALIDVDAQRQQIRELFAMSASNRDELIRNELDDTNLEKLTAARSKLGIISDPKIQFWSAFVRCFPSKKLRLKEHSDEALLHALGVLFPELANDLEQTFHGLNYENYNEEESARLLVHLLLKTGVTMEQFNTFAYPSFDISELYSIDFKRIKDEQKNWFKQHLYHKALKESGLRKEFNKKLISYERMLPTCTQELSFNVQEDLFSKVLQFFDIDLSGDIEVVDLERTLQEHKEELIQQAGAKGITESLVVQFLSETTDMENLLFFPDEIQAILSRLEEWIGYNNNSGGEGGIAGNSKRISFAGKPVLYRGYADLRASLDELLTREDINGFAVEKIHINKISSERSSGSNFDKKPSGRAPKKPKEDLGFLGEYLVYKYLLEKSDKKESVKWVSDYAREAGIQSDGLDGLGYDLQYIPNNAVYPRYVEVKVVGSSDAFHITSQEVKEGERLRKNYEIFLVRNISDPANLSIEIIQGLFDYKGQGSFTDNEKFTVVNDNFIIKFEKV